MTSIRCQMPCLPVCDFIGCAASKAQACQVFPSYTSPRHCRAPSTENPLPSRLPPSVCSKVMPPCHAMKQRIPSACCQAKHLLIILSVQERLLALPSSPLLSSAVSFILPLAHLSSFLLHLLYSLLHLLSSRCRPTPLSRILIIW